MTKKTAYLCETVRYSNELHMKMSGYIEQRESCMVLGWMEEVLGWMELRQLGHKI